jgi:ubiquinone biosynthesis accessory factor UbiK
MVFDTRKLDEIARRLADSLPAGLKHLREDAERNFREVLQGALSRLEIVTREEFDAQAEVLSRTRARLEALDARLAALEEGGRTTRKKTKKK